jgi:hypothetical protein
MSRARATDRHEIDTDVATVGKAFGNCRDIDEGPEQLGMLQRPGVQRCAVSLAKESQQRASAVLRAMAKGLRRPDQVAPLQKSGQVVGLLKKM